MAEYSADLSISVSKGKYSWCGNGYDGNKSGHYLSENGENQIMLRINIKMNSQLFADKQIIEIRDMDVKNSALYQYTMPDNFEKNSMSCKFFYPITDNMLEKEFRMKFCKILPMSEMQKLRLCRAPCETIYEKIFVIPKLPDVLRECSICLENIDNDVFISECSHVFHAKCMTDLFINNKKFETNIRCEKHCDHGGKIKSYTCPYCMTVN